MRDRLAPAVGVITVGMAAFVSYLIGMFVLSGLWSVLVAAYEATDPPVLTYKVSWSVIAFLLAPGAAALASLLLGRRRRPWALVLAVGLYGLTIGLLLPIISMMHGCGADGFPLGGGYECD